MKGKVGNIVFYVLYLVVVVALVSYLFFNDYGVLKYLQLKDEISDLEAKIKKTEDSLIVLDMEIDSLNVSLRKIEEVARENHHMLKKNERAYYIEEN